MVDSSSGLEESSLLKRMKEAVDDYIRSLDEIVTFVMLSTPDGLPVMTTLEAGTTINEFLSASGSAISEIAHSYSEYAGSGRLKGVVISGEKGCTILRKLDDNLVLAIGFLSRDITRNMEISSHMQNLLSSIIGDEKEGGSPRISGD